MIRTLFADAPSRVSRRSLMLGAGALPIAVGACAVTDPATGKIDPAAIDRAIKTTAKDAKLIAAGFKTVLAQLSALDIPALTPRVIEVSGIAIDGIVKVADALQSATTIAEAQAQVAKLITYAQSVAGALATLPLPREVQTALQASVILLPVIQTTIGLIANRMPETSEIDGARAVLTACAAGQ